MQITDKVFASYLDCEYKGYLKHIGKSDVRTELESLNDETLNTIKENYFESISSKFENEHIQRDLLITTEVLKKGFHYLLNNSIQNNEIANTLDVLVRKTGESFLGNYFYEPMLILPNFKITKREKLLLAFKSILISNLQKKLLSTGKIIYGNPVKALTVRFFGLYDEANTIISKIHKFSNNEKSLNFFLNKHCNFCEFRTYCYDKAKEADCLSLFTGMKQKEITKLNNKGFFTINQLSYTFKPRKRVKKSLKVVKKHHYALKALAIRKNKIYVYEKPELPSPSVKIYLDVEGDPDRNLFYLIGFVIETRTSLKDYSFWANDESEIKEKTKLFLDSINRYKDFTIYHYGNYETRFLNFIRNSTNKRKDEEIEKAIHKSVNVLSLMNTSVYFPTYSSGLKEIANYLGFSWTIDNSSGIQSIVWRRKWEKEDDQKLKNDLILYNKEDCLALRVLVKFLLSVNNKRNNSETKLSIESVDNLIDRNSDRYGGHEFRKINFCLKEFEHINECAYFDYQKNKVLVRTGKSRKKKPKTLSRQQRFKYKPNKEILIPKSRACPKCKSKRIKSSNQKRLNSKVVVDLKFFNGGMKKWVIKYSCIPQYCVNCGKRFTPRKYKTIRGKYGYGIISWSIYQNISNHASLEKTKKTLFDCFQVSIKNPSLCELKIKAASFYQKTYNNLILRIKAWDIIHVDETRVSLRGKPGYIWVFTNIKDVVFLYRETRETKFIHKLIKGFKGVFISDFYKGYDSLKCKQQKCLIHLMRDINDALFKDQQNDELKYIASNFGFLLKAIVGTIDKYGLKKRNLNKHNKDVEKFFKNIQQKPCDSEVAASLTKRFVRSKDSLFTFLNHDGVPWNNNNAEHAFKHFARHRRNIDGSFTKNGINRYLIFLSIYETCKYKDVNFLEYLLSKKDQFENYVAKHTVYGNKRKPLGGRLMEHKGNHDKKDTFLDGENYHLD